MITLKEMSMLTTLYTQPHRHYHNLYHILDCLTELENFVHPDIDNVERGWLEAAIWYHDAVYNPYSTLNEWNSMKLAEEQNQPEQVQECVIYTRNHSETIDWSRSQVDKRYQFVVQVMLDIDLAGFGQSFDVCWAHAANIRKEYYKTTDHEFNLGRLNFLRTINKRESLYYTDFFKKKYDVQSKWNLAEEIKRTEAAIYKYQGYPAKQN